MNNPVAGRTKTVQNYISATYPDCHVETLFTPLVPFETPKALDRISFLHTTIYAANRSKAVSLTYGTPTEREKESAAYCVRSCGGFGCDIGICFRKEKKMTNDALTEMEKYDNRILRKDI